MVEKKLTVEELVKALRCCSVTMSCTGCPLHDGTFCGGFIEVARKAAAALERMNDFEHSSCMELLAKNGALKEQLAAALEENTRLAEQLSVKSEQLESLRTIFYEVTGFVPSKDLQLMPLPKTLKEKK